MKDIYSNAQAVAFVLDSEHVKFAADLCKQKEILERNPDALAIFSAWVELSGSLPFLSVGFIPGRLGITGGMAADWNNAIVLTKLIHSRFDDAVAGNQSAWMVVLEDQRVSELRAQFAQ